MSWAFPKIIQRLFADGGASRKLRGDILPFGSTAETACEGNDPRLTKQASTAEVGHVRLNNTVTSTSTTEAATASAVKTAYDKANSAASAANSAQSTANSAQSTANQALNSTNGPRIPTGSTWIGTGSTQGVASSWRFTVPRGGTWAIFLFGMGGSYTWYDGNTWASVVSGGTVIGGAFSNGGFCWRIA